MAEPTLDEAGIFNIARQIGTPEARAQYIRQACGEDTGLCARVEALLRIHDQERSFLQSPVSVPPVAAASGESPGTQIGPYKLLEQIGEGGFGVVFMAEQKQPIRRTVAVKILKAGMDTRQVVARFEAERQALALMDHPNIGRVLDGGETPSGRPYFVMELVKGVPITRYCDEHRLTPQERLALFVDVCAAVQHAHQKGIVHRDLKPTNVLVAAYDGRPVPKLIDFGVAKALGQRLTERTLVTGFGGIVGTLEYMSPEQAEFNALDIDTRADIYSLGVLLYELLTGTTPLTRERLRVAAVSEVLRLIREEEPPKPSTRLSDSKDSLASISAQRKLEPAQLTRQIRGDLDWIVMKALEKNRNQRYGSSGNLAEDVERYLRGDPILARPPSVLYRLGKFARRHCAAVAAGFAVTLALLTGTAVASWQAVVATGARDAALIAAAAEKAAKEEASAREAETQAVLAFVQNRIFRPARPKGLDGGLGREVTLRRALEAALPDVDKSFANQPLVEARVRMTLASSFWYLGDWRIASDQYLRARTIFATVLGPEHADTLACTNNLAMSYAAAGRTQEALKLHEEALQVMKAKHGPGHPDTLRSMYNLALAYAAAGRTQEALKLHEETFQLMKTELGPDHPYTLRSMTGMAVAYAAAGRTEEALKLCEDTLRLMKGQLGPEHADTLVAMDNLAKIYDRVGREIEAHELREKTLAKCKELLGHDHPFTLTSMNNLANSYSSLERYGEALRLHEETLALRKLKLDPDHPDTLKSMSNVANCYGLLGRHEDAAKLHQETLSRRRAALGVDHPHTLYSTWRLAASLVKLNRDAEALPLIDECLRRAPGKIVDQRLFPEVGDLRLRHFEKTKDASGCRRTAELWEKLQRTDFDSLYQAACCRAVTAAVLLETNKSPAAAKQAEDEAVLAMGWLRKAVAAGYRDAAKLKENKDFGALRERPDFRKLLTDLQSAAVPEPMP